MAPTATEIREGTELNVDRDPADVTDAFPDEVTEEGHQHDRVDHNVEGVYGGAGYHRSTHGIDADDVLLPGMRLYGHPEQAATHVQNADVATPADEALAEDPDRQSLADEALERARAERAERELESSGPGRA